MAYGCRGFYETVGKSYQKISSFLVGPCTLHDLPKIEMRACPARWVHSGLGRPEASHFSALGHCMHCDVRGNEWFILGIDV